MARIESAGIAGLVERCHERLEHGIRRSSYRDIQPREDGERPVTPPNINKYPVVETGRAPSLQLDPYIFGNSHGALYSLHNSLSASVSWKLFPSHDNFLPVR